MEKNKWEKIGNQSLAVATRNAGFDLSIYSSYSDDVKLELKKKAIKEAIYNIKVEFEFIDVDISGIKKGVYVIALSSPLSIMYKTYPSPLYSSVIYIGMGNVIGRLGSHFHNSLFDFMQSLSGANFDFYISEPEMDGHADYYKHIEWRMINDFSKRFSRKPILNKNAGSKRNIQDEGEDWWKRPIKNSGKQPRWALLPTKHSGFGELP